MVIVPDSSTVATEVTSLTYVYDSDASVSNSSLPSAFLIYAFTVGELKVGISGVVVEFQVHSVLPLLSEYTSVIFSFTTVTLMM